MNVRIERLLHSRTIRAIQVLLFWCGALIGIVWALPLTLFGLLLAVPVVLARGNMQCVRNPTPALLVRGPLADWLLHHHPFGAMNAMAIGHVILGTHDGMSSRVLIHELAHVRQAARWGIVFPFAYLAASLWAALRGRNAYWHNRFEVAARKAEKHY